MYIRTDTDFILNIYKRCPIPTCSVAQWLVDWTTEWAGEVRISNLATFFTSLYIPLNKVTCKCQWIFIKTDIYIYFIFFLMHRNMMHMERVEVDVHTMYIPLSVGNRI